MKKRDDKGLDRRGFLRAVGGASTGAAIVAAGTATPIAATDAQAYNPGPEETKARYRESEHVKTFYRTNRY